MQVGLGHNSSQKGLALWRGQRHASFRAGVPLSHSQLRLGVAPPIKKTYSCVPIMEVEIEYVSLSSNLWLW